MPHAKKHATRIEPSKSGHKRQVSSPETGATPPSATRSSKRLKATPTKSQYFTHSSGDDEPSTDSEKAHSGYDDESISEQEESATSDQEYDSEEEQKPAKRRLGKTSKKTPDESQVVSKDDLWREGVKTGLGPGKQVFIEKPKARGDGGIKYIPERIHPNTLEFLRDLRNNNDRMWFKAHDPDYRASWKDWETTVEVLTERIAEIDPTVPELPPKDLVFRVYRDIRFSSDPTPYKPHFSAAFSRTGRKGPYACYYVHIEPGNKSFVGSGLWHPEAEPIRLLRTDIDTNSQRMKGVLLDPEIRKHVFGGIAKDEKKAIKAFCKQNAENALKTKPKGYEIDNPNIELLKLRNFTMGQKIPDTDILSPKGVDCILNLVRIMRPFVEYLNSVVMPDEAEDDGSELSSTVDQSESD